MSILDSLPVFKTETEIQRDQIEQTILESIVKAMRNHDDEDESKHLVKAKIDFPSASLADFQIKRKIISSLTLTLVARNIATELMSDEKAMSNVLLLEWNNRLAHCNTQEMFLVWFETKARVAQ